MSVRSRSVFAPPSLDELDQAVARFVSADRDEKEGRNRKYVKEARIPGALLIVNFSRLDWRWRVSCRD